MKQARSGRGLAIASSLLLSLTLRWTAASAQTPAAPMAAGNAKVHGQPVEAFGGYGGGARIPEPVLPSGFDVFNLTAQTRRFSRSYNFEVVGHSYFKGPWLSPFAKQHNSAPDSEPAGDFDLPATAHDGRLRLHRRRVQVPARREPHEPSAVAKLPLADPVLHHVVQRGPARVRLLESVRVARDPLREPPGVSGHDRRQAA